MCGLHDCARLLVRYTTFPIAWGGAAVMFLLTFNTIYSSWARW